MPVIQKQFTVETNGRGMYEVTDLIAREVEITKLSAGIASLFCQHTSCSLVVMENADPSARLDLERWLDRLVRDDDPHFEHTAEGPDDMPSHIKMALTRTSETIPISRGQLLLGTWQGVFLWEHRDQRHSRKLVLTIYG